MIQLLGGPTTNDSQDSLLPAWAIAHGHLACAYPANAGWLRAPLYPLVSGVAALLTRIGHGVPFPTSAALGPNCSRALSAMNNWSVRSGAIVPSLRIAFLSFLVLAGGVVAFLRASGRGRCGWEPAAVCLVSLLSPVFMCIDEYFHPEDLMAIGLALGGLAMVRRGRWAWAGALLGLALTSQQFVLLVIAPLLVMLPANRRMIFAGFLGGAFALVSLPFVALTSGRAIDSIVGLGNTQSGGETLLGVLHLGSVVLFAASRLLPIALALGLALWAKRRLGVRVLEPLPLASVVATSLALRLVFEVYLYGYYFMAVGVMFIVLDVLQRRISLYSIGWIAVVTLAFDPVRFGGDPLYVVPVWVWQLLLVPTAITLAVRPLISYGDVCSSLPFEVSKSQLFRAIKMVRVQPGVQTRSGT
jgi:hypothetical protein